MTTIKPKFKVGQKVYIPFMNRIHIQRIESHEVSISIRKGEISVTTAYVVAGHTFKEEELWADIDHLPVRAKDLPLTNDSIEYPF